MGDDGTCDGDGDVTSNAKVEGAADTENAGAVAARGVPAEPATLQDEVLIGIDSGDAVEAVAKVKAGSVLGTEEGAAKLNCAGALGPGMVAADGAGEKLKVLNELEREMVGAMLDGAAGMAVKRNTGVLGVVGAAPAVDATLNNGVLLEVGAEK